MPIPSNLLFATILHSFFGTFIFYCSRIFNLLDNQARSFLRQSYLENYGKNLTEYQIEWFYSGLTQSNLVGAVIITPTLGYLIKEFGPKGCTVIIKNLLAILGSLLCFSSWYCNRFELLYLGTAVIGGAMAIVSYHAIYMNECAHIKARGFVSILPSIGTRLSAAFGMVVGLPHLFGSGDRWRFAFLVPAIVCTIHLVLAIFLPESPKHFYIRLNEKERAKRSLIFYHGNTVNIGEIFEEYEDEIVKVRAKGKARLLTILKTKHLRWPFFLFLCIIMLNVVNGFGPIQSYSKTILSSYFSENEAALYSVLIIELPIFFFMFLGLFVATKFGRRPVLLCGLGIAIIGDISIAITGMVSFPFLSVIGMFLVNVGQCGGPSTVVHCIAGELCPQISLPTTVSFCATVDHVSSFILCVLYPPLQQQYGSSIMVFYAVCGILCFLFLFKCLPETRNRTVIQVISQWVPEETDERSSLLSHDTFEIEL